MTVTAPLPPPDEADRHRRLVRMKRVAGGLLIVSTIVFVVARLYEPSYPWLGYIRAAAEAAMIGGIADWFAVTALFRHPLGIPIPHTAIIPARKDRVGRTLGGFVQKNFLARDVIAARLRSLEIARRLATWMREPANARTVSRHVANAVARALPLLRDDEVQHLIDRALAERVRATTIAPILGRFLALVTSGGRHQELLDEAIRLAARGVADNHDLIRDRIAAESPWWVPVTVDEKIHEKIVGAIERGLGEIRDDPGHPLRERFDDALDRFVDKLQHDPEVIARAEQIKNDTLDAEAVRRFSGSLWSDAKAAVLRYAERTSAERLATDDEHELSALERSLTGIGETLLADPSLLERVDGAIVDGVLHVVERHQDEVGALIANTVAAWDPKVTSERIELAIGRDLQFIRVNGTLVGGLVGLALYVASRWLG
jgi:uncharacterized membrane-anchored protein YjiN (DUF445 family)